ncbi:MAG: GumC family protein [Leptolyngbyaceae cyanobacterium]
MDNLTTSNSLVSEGNLRELPQLPWDDDDLDLKQLITVLRRRVWLIAAIAAGVMGTVIINTLRQEPVYEGNLQLLVEPVNADNQIQDFSELLGDNAPGPSSGLDYETQVQVLRSPRLIEQVLAELTAVEPDIDYETLLENLTIRRVDETKIIEIRYQGEDPVKIQQTLDILADVYLDYSLRERQTNLRQGIQFVNKQLPELEGRVNELQSDLETFRQTHNFIDPTTQNAQIANRAEILSTQRLDIDRQLAQAQTAYGLLESTTGGEAALQNAEVYQQLVQEMRSVEAEIAAGLTRFQPDSLRIRVLEEKRDRLLPILEAEAQRVISAVAAGAFSDIQVLETESQTLTQAETQLQETLTQLPTLARQYSDLQRELEISVRALSRFLETRETLQIEAAQTEIPWELIEAPLRPTDPIAPNIRRSLLLGAVASMLLGIGAALLLEKLDSVCRTVDEIKAILKLPVLGVVPYQREFDTAGVVNESGLTRLLNRFERHRTNGHDGGYGGSQFLEAMRLLQTNLMLLGTDRPIQSIIMTSSMPGEGKSTVAQHLAQTAATMGKRVLLVDADMRQPVIHQRLELSNDKGLSDLLSGNAKRSEVVQRAMPFVDFYTITAGTIPPDPVKLLSSKRMQRIMSDLEKDYDLIVYDAPPLVGLADTTLIAPHTDGVVVVARVNKCDRDVLGYVTENIRFAKVPVLGMVANGVIPDGKSYKYYAYGYGTQQQPTPPHNNGNNGAGNSSKKGLDLASFTKYRK